MGLHPTHTDVTNYITRGPSRTCVRCTSALPMASTDSQTQVAEPALDAPNAASAPAYEHDRQSHDSGREATLTSGLDDPGKVHKSSPEKQERASEDDGVIIVDWEGPDDPANPRKCVL